MSTILEAIKKSEQERKLKDIPTLSDMPAPQERVRWPLYTLILLVVVLMAVIVWYLLPDRLTIGLRNPVVPVMESISDGDEPAAVQDESIAASLQDTPDEIVVNVVSFSEEPSQRFVIINGKLFHEGDFVRAGLKVEEIHQESVLLNERGKEIIRQP